MLLFAAGTDSELYEQELRALGLPTYRATGRGYYGQQQVLDLLAYLRLLHNRYDDEALFTVLASPFVGVSNDALVLLRRAAPRRPLFSGLERGLPPGLSEDDERLFRAFRQRYERLTAASDVLSLEQLCEQIVSEHDYDLALLAQWDGRQRYANVRKLARMARSFEELRGPDIEGFVRFVTDLGAAGASAQEAPAEEEGSDSVRLLTIHAAKGLEFKVVVVADAGRGSPNTFSDEILCLADGRFGFRVADPGGGKRRPALGYELVRETDARPGGGRAAPPLLRRHDAGDRAPDRLGRGRSGAKRRRPQPDRMDARAAGRGRARAGRRRASGDRLRRNEGARPNRSLPARGRGARRREGSRASARAISSRSSSRGSLSSRTPPRRRRRSSRSRRYRRRRCTGRGGSRTARYDSSKAAPTATSPSASAA